MKKLTIRNSPRLLLRKDAVLCTERAPLSPFLEGLARRVIRDADWLVRQEPLREDEGEYYGRARRWMQSHLECLTQAWILTRRPRFRKAAIRHLAGLMTWHHYSCDANEFTPKDREMPFCLTHGEHSTAIALMYDSFREDITPAEQQVFFDVLDRAYLKQALKCLDDPPWWAFKDWSNWNGVCSGGMGMLALAFYEEIPEAAGLIPFVEKSLGEYFKCLVRNGGGSHEGTGYWNFGMSFAIRYLLSWENATGRRHPAFRIKEMNSALYFPLDFTGLSFGDNDSWRPTAFFFLLAERLGEPDAAIRAAAFLPEGVEPRRRRKGKFAESGDLLYAANCIPSAAEVREARSGRGRKRVPVARVCEGLEWAAIADDRAAPRLRLTARGGSSEIKGHGHVDLLSFKCMVKGELMITDQVSGGTGVTFRDRGHEQYDRSPASKSTLFVDGLGCRTDAACDSTTVVGGGDILGIRIDGSHAYMPGWQDVFIGRLLLLVESTYWIVIDRVSSTEKSGRRWIESRFHTYADWSRGRNWVSLRSGSERMTMCFASLGDAVMQESVGMPTLPRRQTSVFRWMSADRYLDNVMVASLSPGARKLRLTVRRGKAGTVAIDVAGPKGYRRTIRIGEALSLES